MRLITIIPSVIPKLCVVNSNSSIEYNEAMTIFNEGTKVAFRSSANIEDGVEHSFAGMFDTFLDIEFNEENFSDYVQRCLNSKNNLRLKEYLKENNIDESNLKISVIVQEMFESEYAGVCFKYKDNVSKLSIGQKDSVVNGEDSQELEINEDIYNKLPSEIPKNIWEKLFETFDKIIEEFDMPQDIEWAVNKNSIAILQSRPITKFSQKYSDIQTWDSTNIGENYPGITLPLTFSFIKNAYSNVYRSFLKIVGVDSHVINSNKYVFDNMLGYVNGHIYYNIGNWYELLKLLPFYETNKEFFDNMLSPAKKNDSKSKPKFKPKIGVMYRFALKIVFPRRLFRSFDLDYEKLLSEYRKYELSNISSITMTKLFDSISDKFFEIWGITILNDFRTMIFFGILTKLSKKWIEDHDEYLNSIINTGNHPESLEPLRALQNIARIINNNKAYKILFQSDSSQILKKLQSPENFELKEHINEYLEQYGNRSANELKLEEPKLNESPEKLITLIKSYLSISDVEIKSKSHSKYKLKISWFKRRIINVLQKVTVNSVYKREEYRLKRGKVFDFARKVFIEIGKRLKDQNLIEDKNDIFYLEKDEIWNIVRFHTTPQDLKYIISERKKFLDSKKDSNLPIRIKSSGYVSREGVFVSDVDESNETELVGKITSKVNYFVKAEVVVMKEFDIDVDVRGKILIASKTDPGWTIFFPLIKGIVTEKGNTLSHASIIARELNIPCIVGVENVTNILKTGDRILLNSDSGKIQLLNDKHEA